jgi:hypothetical protein
MIEPRTKRRFQIHLSTAVILMFVAGGIISLNVRSSSKMTYVEESYQICPTVVKNADGTYYLVPENRVRHVLVTPHGWPLKAENKTLERYWNRTNIAINVIVALAILSLAGFICEWWIRRRVRTAVKRPIGR